MQTALKQNIQLLLTAFVLPTQDWRFYVRRQPTVFLVIFFSLHLGH